MKITLIEISKIKEHEAVDSEHLKKIKSMIVGSGFFKEPIVIDRNTLVILDGHHRLNSCKELGLKKIPCLVVDYMNDKSIKVLPRRQRIPVNKKIVIAMGLSGKVFPKKTTKHFIPGIVKDLKIPIKQLL